MSSVNFCIYVFLKNKTKQEKQKFVKSHFSFQTDYFEQDIRQSADTRCT